MGLCALASQHQTDTAQDAHRDAQTIEYFDQARECAERFPDDDLLGFSLLSRGQVLIRLSQPTEGTNYLDEAKSTATAGFVYCAVILEAQSTFHLVRAREWTSALTEWCAVLWRNRPRSIERWAQVLGEITELLVGAFSSSRQPPVMRMLPA